MRSKKKVKRAIVLLLLFLTAGLVFQPSRAAEAQCGIWCPQCAKWQENFKAVVPEYIAPTERNIITVSCRDCGNALIKVTRWTGSSHNDIDSWWTEYTVKRCSGDVVFPEAEVYREGDDDSDDSYRVVADGDVFGVTGYGWTTEAIYNQAVSYISPLFNSLFNCAKGEFTWEDWYKSGMSTSASGVVSSPLIKYMEKLGKKAVLQEELTPPSLSVTGDATVQVYRNGVLTENAWQSGGLKAGDVIQIRPMKVSGREYADYTISENAENVSWQEAAQTLEFTMPAGEVNAVISYRKVKELKVELSSLFYETYQKEPYWDGESFNLDCEPPITVENGMLTVKAVLQHDRTLEIIERNVTGFTITSGQVIVNQGNNTITVSADVLGDGYILEGSCAVRADSSALKDLMEETDSETYTELKSFVEDLMDNVSDYEKMVDDLSNKLEVSEEQRTESERKLEESLAELELLQEKINKDKEQMGEMSAELEEMSEELEEMKETLTAMQEFLKQMTGEENPDEDLLEKAKEELEALKESRDNLTTELDKIEKEKANLLEKNEGLMEKNQELEEKNGSLTDKNESLQEKNQSLQEKNEELIKKNQSLQEKNEELVKKNEVLEEKNKGLTEKNEGLEEKNKSLTEKNEGLEEKNKSLTEKNEGLEEKNKSLTEKNESLAKKNESLTVKNESQLKKIEDLEEKNKNLSDTNIGLSGLLEQVQNESKELKTSYAAMEKKYEELGGTLEGLMQDNTLLNEQYAASEKERQNWENKYELLSVKSEIEKKTEKETVTEVETETESEEGLYMEKETLKEWTAREEFTTTETTTFTETTAMTETEPSEETKKEEVNYQGIGTYSDRKLLPGIVVVLAAMLLGGGILFLGMERKELPFKLEKLKNLG